MNGIVAYTYQADEYHPHCISIMFTGTDWVDAEPHLDRIAAERGIARYPGDTEVFPVPVLDSEGDALYYEDPDHPSGMRPRSCGRCLGYLDDLDQPCVNRE